jgi:hypothetical protein
MSLNQIIFIAVSATNTVRLPSSATVMRLFLLYPSTMHTAKPIVAENLLDVE